MTLQREDVGDLWREIIVDWNLPSAGLIHYHDSHAIAESRLAFDCKAVNVFDDGVFAFGFVAGSRITSKPAALLISSTPSSTKP